MKPRLSAVITPKLTTLPSAPPSTNCPTLQNETRLGGTLRRVQRLHRPIPFLFCLRPERARQWPATIDTDTLLGRLPSPDQLSYCGCVLARDLHRSILGKGRFHRHQAIERKLLNLVALSTATGPL